MTEEEKIEEMDKEIAELERKKAELAEKAESEIVGIVPDTPENRKIMEEVSKPEPPKVEKKEKFIPPDPITKIIEGGNIWIEWIDNRYHINGVRGIQGSNKIIVRSLGDIDFLVKDLIAAVKAFDQKEMINTKAPK